MPASYEVGDADRLDDQNSIYSSYENFHGGE